MKPGGGAAKGAQFERTVACSLSLWLTGGARADVFARNVSSGGKFTKQRAAGLELNMPGDLAAAHPLANDFAAKYMVECKFVADVKIMAFIQDNRHKPKSWLGLVIAKARDEARAGNRDWLVIAKQNQFPPFLVCDAATAGAAALHAAVRLGRLELRPHIIHGFAMFRLEDFVAYVRPQAFLHF